MDVDHDLARTTLCDEEKLKDFSDVESREQGLATFPKPSNFYKKAFIAFGVIAVLTPILYFTISGWTSARPQTKMDQCGTTADEARARGCIFETTGFSWVTKECYDPVVEEAFLKHIATNDIKLFRDRNYTREVPMEEVRLGNGQGFYVFQEYHVAHCMFLIEKLHRALLDGKPVDGYTMPFVHTEHCIKQAMLPPGARKDDHQASYTKWPYCGRPGGFNVDWRKPHQWTDY